MRSRAAIGNHPLHPALVGLPIGAFFLAMVADVAFLVTHRAFWAEMAAASLAVGALTAVAAAFVGLIDFTALPLGTRLRRTAVVHLVLNVAAVVLYASSLYVRSHAPDLRYTPSALALSLSFVALGLLGVSGWLGGQMVFEMHAGVVESRVAAKQAS
jgi:uncharacterized membrane protein